MKKEITICNWCSSDDYAKAIRWQTLQVPLLDYGPFEKQICTGQFKLVHFCSDRCRKAYTDQWFINFHKDGEE